MANTSFQVIRGNRRQPAPLALVPNQTIEPFEPQPIQNDDDARNAARRNRSTSVNALCMVIVALSLFVFASGRSNLDERLCAWLQIDESQTAMRGMIDAAPILLIGGFVIALATVSYARIKDEQEPA